MPKKIKAIINSRIRGFILRTIEYGHPHRVGDDVINDCLAQSGVFLSSAQLESFLDYLKDRGYVEIEKAGPEEMAFSGSRRFLIKLTAKGVDLLEGIIEDAGIKLDGAIEQ